MTGDRRTFCTVLAILLALSAAPMLCSADLNDPLIIESDVLVSVDVPQSEWPQSLLVQATSWVGSSYEYVLTLANFSPWPMPALYVLDRYFPENPEQEEIAQEWIVGNLEPGESASFVFSFPEGPMTGSCHQLEISLADGLGFVLMDCTPAGATTIWNVGLTEEMEAYLVEPPLTVAEPSGPSKLGIHVTRNSSPVIMQYVRAARPAVVVAVGDLGWLTEVKEVSPETVTIGRFAEGDQTIGGDPAWRAREFVNAHAADYLVNPGVDYWLGWNEPVFDDVWQVQWYAIFEAERTLAMAELGLKVAVGNFSAGTPEASEFEAFLPALGLVRDYGGILAVHEYSAPTLHTGVGAAIPGHEGGEGYGALTLRYRYWYEHYLRPNDMVLPLVVTEAGIDGGVLRAEDIRLMGWRDFSKKDLPEPLRSQASGSYLEQLSWYDDELRCDPYVIGFAVFNVGDSEGHWASFDMTDMLPEVATLAGTKE